MNEDLNVDKNGKQKGKGGGIFKMRYLLLFVAAVVLIVVIINNVVVARTPGEPGVLLNSSCCASTDASSPEELIKQAGLEYYRINYGDEAVEAVVEDYGCHQEIHIYQNGELKRRLSYSNGIISDLDPPSGSAEN